jgi:cell division FtsZ-interacting protein ZapD
MIPTHVTVDHAWESSAPNAFSGMLLNISRGGATLRLAGTLAPRTRLRLALPTSAVARNLPAQVVWTSAIPGRRRRSAIYGIRWMEEFSPQVLDALRMLLGPESA